MENYHNFDKINNKKSLKIRDFVDFIGAIKVEVGQPLFFCIIGSNKLLTDISIP